MSPRQNHPCIVTPIESRNAASPDYQPRPGYPEIQRPPLYGIKLGGGQIVYEGMFVCNGKHVACIVAVVDHAHGQWAAYMGGDHGDVSEDEAILATAARGIKVPRDFGVKCFPELPAELWRV